MRSQILSTCSLGAVPYDMPHDPLRYALSPSLACATHAPKYAAFAHAAGHEPGIDGTFDPIRNGDCSNVPALADPIDDCPVILAPLKMSNLQLCRFFPAQPATQ